MKVLDLLEDLEDLIENGSSIPLTGRVVLDREDLLELVKDIRLQLPDEIKQAKWIKEERNKILAEAQDESERITKEAQSRYQNIVTTAKDEENRIINNTMVRVDELVEEEEIYVVAKEKSTEIINEANLKAQEILKNAHDETNDLRLGSLEYADKLLSEVQEKLKVTMETIEDNRDELKQYIEE
ncbi:MAG: ATPase [Firmicutes bacterium]|jgi:cell division septum initiation protein DivIVA|nr:ATPase [Bacillota bacterium]